MDDLSDVGDGKLFKKKNRKVFLGSCPFFNTLI